MATYDCTDKGCVDVDLTQLRGGDHPIITAPIRAYAYHADKDIWVDGQLYQEGGRLFWDFNERKCTPTERARTGDRCKHEQTFQALRPDPWVGCSFSPDGIAGVGTVLAHPRRTGARVCCGKTMAR